MCPVSLWAILPFCSVKYNKHSGEGKELGIVWLTSLPRLNSLNQEPGLSFAQDVTLDWWDGIDRETEEEEEEEVEENVKEEETGPTQNPLSVLNPILSAALSSELLLQAWNSI